MDSSSLIDFLLVIGEQWVHYVFSANFNRISLAPRNWYVGKRKLVIGSHNGIRLVFGCLVIRYRFSIDTISPRFLQNLIIHLRGNASGACIAL